MGFLDELKDKTEEVIETSRTASMVTMPARPTKIPPRALKKGP
jgi:hypothetical protein